MIRETELNRHFDETASVGFGDHVEGRLKAQDNPEFLNNYRSLLENNDRVIHMDLHSDQAGINFLASDENMQIMKDSGAEYLLVELTPELNELIQEYEKGDISKQEFEESYFPTVYEHEVNGLAFVRGISVEEAEELVPYDKLLEVLKQTHAPFLEAVDNGIEHGIKVRCFDNAQAELGQEASEDPKNAHIDDPLYRRDDAWDSLIHAEIGDKKAVMLAGAAHIATSYGIDESMEDRGLSVATFRVRNEQDFPLVSDEKYNNPNFMQEFFADSARKDRDGFDTSDFKADLFYDEQSKSLSVAGAGDKVPEPDSMPIISVGPQMPTSKI